MNIIRYSLMAVLMIWVNLMIFPGVYDHTVLQRERVHAELLCQPGLPGSLPTRHPGGCWDAMLSSKGILPTLLCLRLCIQTKVPSKERVTRAELWRHFLHLLDHPHPGTPRKVGAERCGVHKG